MTDITELAQRARINAECGEHLSPAETLELVEALESEKRICATWRKTAKSTGEKLEKAQTINAAAEKLVRCKGRYHSEQNYRALAALFGVTTPDLPPLEHENVHYADAAEMEIAALRQRIAELEEAEQKLCAANITLDARAELAERQLAELESRTVTVKLPTTRLWAGVTECYEKSDVIAAIRSAGMEVSDD
ncbi:TPA: ead/Ea22-like family protein [Klebsiella pneumoniae]